jgi:anti-sigma28 factor (negative regulator of flagellin synthesis)
VTDSTPHLDEGRSQRLEALKTRIERGQYRVPAERVADAVILWYRRMEPGQSDVSSPTSS